VRSEAIRTENCRGFGRFCRLFGVRSRGEIERIVLFSNFPSDFIDLPPLPTVMDEPKVGNTVFLLVNFLFLFYV
jgi:hypothetical protein